MKIFLPFKHNSVFNEVEKEFEIVPTIDQCDWVFLWNDINPMERGVINLARSKNKKTAVLQHGRKGSSKYYPPFNEKIQADTMFVWGDFDRRSLIGAGQDSSRIRVVGTTVLDGLPDRQPHEGINIVFCPEHWDAEVEENSWVKKELRKLRYKNKKIKITTKIIESHDPKNYDNPIQTNRNADEHLRVCKEVLSTADLVVGVSESTFELLAQAMGIPVVIMEEWTPKACNGDERYKTYRRVISRASRRATVKTLNQTILEELADPDNLSMERYKVAYDEGGVGLDTIKLIKKEL